MFMMFMHALYSMDFGAAQLLQEAFLRVRMAFFSFSNRNARQRSISSRHARIANQISDLRLVSFHGVSIEIALCVNIVC